MSEHIQTIDFELTPEKRDEVVAKLKAAMDSDGFFTLSNVSPQTAAAAGPITENLTRAEMIVQAIEKFENSLDNKTAEKLQVYVL